MLAHCRHELVQRGNTGRGGGEVVHLPQGLTESEEALSSSYRSEEGLLLLLHLLLQVFEMGVVLLVEAVRVVKVAGLIVGLIEAVGAIEIENWRLLNPFTLSRVIGRSSKRSSCGPIMVR